MYIQPKQIPSRALKIQEILEQTITVQTRQYFIPALIEQSILNMLNDSSKGAFLKPESSAITILLSILKLHVS